MPIEQGLVAARINSGPRPVEIVVGWSAAFCGVIGVVLLSVAFYVAAAIDVVRQESLFGRNESVIWTLRFLSGLALLYATCFVLLHCGCCLLYGRRICALYLRRFRLNTEVIDPERAEGLHRRMRIFTLDDNVFEPAELPKVERLWTVVGPPLAVAAAFIFFWTATYTLLTGRVTVGNASSWLMATHVISWVTATISFVGALAFFWRQKLRRDAFFPVAGSQQISFALAEIHAAGAWWFRSGFAQRQSTVFKVADSIWQEVVRRSVEQCDVVIIDISDSSSVHLQWELECVERSGIPSVVIASEAMVSPSALKWAHDSSAVLRYRPEDKKGMVQFRRVLSDRVAAVARRRRAPLALKPRVLWMCRESFGSSLVVAKSVLAGLVTGIISYWSGTTIVAEIAKTLSLD